MQSLSDSRVGNTLPRSMDIDIDKEGNRKGLFNDNNNNKKFTYEKKRFLAIKSSQKK